MGGPSISDELVSVVIPVFNGERFVSRTLASVLAQTYRHIEVIVVDDGSTDRSRDIVSDFAGRDHRVHLFNGPHAGVAVARNTGIEHSKGALIAPVDADDLWHPQKLSLQVEKMRRSSAAVGVVYCLSAEIDEQDQLITHPGIQALPEGEVLTRLIERNFLSNGSTPLIRRSLLETVGGYDPSLRAGGAQGAEDWKLYLELAAICEFAFIPAHLVGYRKCRASMSEDVEQITQSGSLVSQWIKERWPYIPKIHWKRQRYFTNSFLADQALKRNQFADAIRFHLLSFAAMPSELMQRETLNFYVRMAARLVGFRRSQMKRTPLDVFWACPLPVGRE